LDGPYIYLSYRVSDRPLAERLVRALNASGINIWWDVGMLTPGNSFEDAIGHALRRATATVLLFSQAAAQSDWVLAEARVALQVKNLLPVRVGQVDIPAPFQGIQFFQLSEEPSEEDLLELARDITRAFLERTNAPVVTHAPISDQAISTFVASELKRVANPSPPAGPANSVFLVHGHDEDARGEVERFLTELGVRPIVLKEVEGTDQSLLQRFLRVSSEAQFAVVIMSADDWGASRKQYEMQGVGERALQFRARQNVLLELGFFYGALGWDHVFGLLKDPSIAYPNFERPSDLDGVVYDRIDSTGRWRRELRRRLERAGFALKT
jgi:predicted nucleotide-binding protein